MTPKIIHHVAPEDRRRWSKEWFSCDESWKILKGYKRRIWNDREEIDNYIKKYDPEFFKVLDQFPVIYKIDFVRYLIAEKIGGIITDMDFEVKKDFTKHLKKDSIYLLDSPSSDELYQNGFIISPPSEIWTGFLSFVRTRILENKDRIMAKEEIKGRPLGTLVRKMIGPIALSEYFGAKNDNFEILPHPNFNPTGKYINGDFVFTKHYGTGNWGEM